MTPDDVAHMRRALELAARGHGMVQPNPLVGAVIVRADRIVGEGFHEQYGSAHAEVNALRAAGEAARDATLYVTLEPCSHHGRTPPCTDAVRVAGVRRVVVGAADPNPVAAGGAAVLREAGIEVEQGILARESRRLNASFHHWHERGTPFVTLKLAVSADGRLSSAPGVRTQITGAEAQAEVQRMRAGHDAILAGIGTVLVDDPLLTVRGVPFIRPPVRIIVDSNARLPLSSRLVATVDQAPVWIVCSRDVDAARVTALEAAGVRTFRVPRDVNGLDLCHAFRALGHAGVRSVFAEGGAAIAQSLLRASLVNRMHVFTSPAPVGAQGLTAPLFDDDAPSALTLTSRTSFGSDELTTFESPEFI